MRHSLRVGLGLVLLMVGLAGCAKKPLDTKMVQDRYQAATALAREGKSAKALDEYRWCYEVGMVQVPDFVGVRSSFLLSSVADLGKSYPPAVECLRRWKDQAQAKLKKDPADRSSLRDLASLNHALGDDPANLDYFDGLPPGDPQRRNMGYILFEPLLQAKRYDEALEVFPYESFKEMLAHTSKMNNPRAAPMLLEYSGMKELEALAGAGKLDEARELIGTIRKADASPKMEGQMRERLERAGHPELLGETEAAPAPAAAPAGS